MKHPRIIEEIGRHVWAVTDAAMDAIVRIVTDGTALEAETIFHLARLDASADGSAAGEASPYKFGERIGNTGLIRVEGPIVPRSGMEAISQPRLTSVAELQADLAAMSADPSIERIAMVFDSPGGAVTGISELAAQIRAIEKPVASYVHGMAASAAYWLASSADEIVSADTGVIGEIGTVMTVGVDQAKDRVKIISSQSPRKHADPTTDAGREQYQALVDAVSDVFIDSVAFNRGTSREDVLENYGQGGEFLAGTAKARGMIDSISTFAEFMHGFGQIEAACGGGGSTWKKRKRLSAEAPALPSAATPAAPPADSAAEINQPSAGTNRVDNLNPVIRYLNTGILENKNQDEPKGDASMTLKELLASDPVAKREHDELVAKACEQAVSAVRADMKFAALAAAKDAYPAPIRAMAVAVISGEKSKDALDGAVASFEAMEEAKKSAEARAASAALPPTPAQATETLSADGVIRNEADYKAAIERAKGMR